jgi:2,3-bisphosphoglycerate-independent phosphoglycerate mutase
MKNKLLIFLIDGLGDVNIPHLDSKTPLQLAKTPWLDKLAGTTSVYKLLLYYIRKLISTHVIETGLNGLLDPVEPGLACGSDTAHMSILGYDPRT